MDGSGYYSNGYNDFRNIQTTSRGGAPGNSNLGHADDTVQNAQSHQQSLSSEWTCYYSNNHHSHLHQQSASSHPSHGYIQKESGEGTLSHQQPPSSAELINCNVYQRQQSASNDGNYDYVFPHSHRNSRSEYLSSSQCPPSMTNNVSYGYDLRQSMINGSHVRSDGQCSQLTSSTMNCSHYIPRGPPQAGYVNIHGEYSHPVNYSSAPRTGNSENNNSNTVLLSTSRECYRSQSASNNASHGYDLPQIMVMGSHVNSHEQFSQVTSSTMKCSQYTPQGLDQFGHANLHGDYSHFKNYSSAPITAYPKNNNSNTVTSSTSPAMIPSHIAARSLTCGLMPASNGLEGKQRLRQEIAVEALYDLSNASTGYVQPNSLQPKNIPNGLYHLSSLGQITSSFQTTSNVTQTNSRQVAHSVASCHPFLTAPSVTNEGASTPGFAYVSPSIGASAIHRGGNKEYSEAGNSGSLSAENSRCIAPVSADASHSEYPRKEFSTTLYTPANVKTKVSKTTVNTGKDTSKSHPHSDKSLTKLSQSKSSKHKSNVSQTNTQSKALKTNSSNSSTHAESPKPTVAVAGSRSSRKRRVLPKSIALPTAFSPRHSYRAAAAYSLLRTLSKELRLSPFTLQSFLSALMLPIPSRLLGEIHVRVLRVLFANIGMGCYSKYGRGNSPISLRTRRINRTEKGHSTESESMEPIGDFVIERGCKNLFYLDNGTWPLFYEDYAVATEEKFMDDTSDDDTFIDIRSPAMVLSGACEAQFKASQKSFGTSIDSHNDRVPYPGEGWIDRCPLGPFGRRNDLGRFTCCPFHIHAAINMAHQGSFMPFNTTVGSGSESSTANKRKSINSTIKRKRKDSSDASSSEYDNAESETEFGDSKLRKMPTGKRRRGRPRKYPKSEPCPSTSSIKASRVIDVQVALSYAIKSTDINEQASASNSVTMAAPSSSLFLSHAKEDHSLLTNQKMPGSTPKPPLAIRPQSSEGASTPNRSNAPGFTFPPVFMAPIPPPPVVANALVVPSNVKKTLRRFFSEGDLFQNNSEENDTSASCHQNSSPHKGNQLDNGDILESTDGKVDAVEVEISELVKKISRSPSNPREEISHMVPIKHLRKGIPYHHLSLESKLTMIEFLLDELLTVDEISKELTLRHQLTGQFDFLYGHVPQQSEFEDINNEDECSICGLEGDLLCCDGCPGSFHRQCLGMAPSGKLPQGKWLCTECRVPDASRMGPLGSENRALIGWFTLNELEPAPEPIATFDNTISILPLSHPEPSHSVTSSQKEVITHNCFMSSGDSACQPQDLCRLFSVTPQTVVAEITNSDLSMGIPVDVEFLVSSGKVFARHRSSHRKFTPLGPSSIEPSAASLTNKSSQENSSYSIDQSLPQNSSLVQLLLCQNPPEPLSNAEVIELIKMLGPEMCLRLPWRGLVFDPQKVFGIGDHSITPASSSSISNSLESLIAHQNEKRELLANHLDTANPLDYDNKYRRAPPIPKIKHQLGQFIFPLVIPEVITFPTKVGAHLLLNLSNAASLDSTPDLSPILSMPFPDVLQSIRDSLVKVGRLLYDGSLLDYRWGTLDGWRVKVQNSNSFSHLSMLLVKLADACCPRAFHRVWYEVKENGNVDETTRLASYDPSNIVSSITEDWTPDRESRRRRWERCTTATVFHLLSNEMISTDTDIFKKREATTKRGKKNKISCTFVHCVDMSSIDKERQIATDQQTEIEVMGAARGGCKSTPATSTPQQEIGLYQGLTVSRATSSCSGDMASSHPKPPPHDEPIPGADGKVTECCLTSAPSVNIAEQSSSLILQIRKKSTSAVGVSPGSPISEELDSNSPLKDNSCFSENRDTCPQRKLKATKKRRKTRESSIAPSTKKRRADCHSAIRLQIESLLGLNTSKSSHRTDRESAEMKLDVLEKLLTTSDDSFFFSIAGRKLFEPDGSVPSGIVKRLARNAGSVRAPFIAYETFFEVGECTTCHQWRKSTLNGTTFEDFALSLRFFEGHIDKVVVSLCGEITNQASKSKQSTTTSAIRCEQIDQITGIKEYFVVDTEKNLGRWHSELSLDLETLIVHRFQKISLAREHLNKLQKSQEDEKKQKQLETERLEMEKKRIHTEKRQKELLQRMAQNKKDNSMSGKGKAIKTSAKPKKKPSDAKNIISGPPLLSFDAALNMHRDLTLNLLVTSANRGEASVPVAAMAATRNATMMTMKTTNALLRSTGKALTDEQIKSKMTHAESAAVQEYVKEMNAVKKPSVAQHTFT